MSLSASIVLEGLTILVVDDEPSILELFSFVLQEARAEVVTATSVDQALDILQALQPDVLISDIMMPEKDGFTLLGAVRGLEKKHGWPHIPILAVTAYMSHGTRDLMRLCGFDAYMGKPVDLEGLLLELAKLAGREQQPPQHAT